MLQSDNLLSDHTVYLCWCGQFSNKMFPSIRNHANVYLWPRTQNSCKIRLFYSFEFHFFAHTFLLIHLILYNLREFFWFFQVINRGGSMISASITDIGYKNGDKYDLFCHKPSWYLNLTQSSQLFTVRVK